MSMVSKVKKKEVEHASRIIRVLKKHPYGLWIREIARQAGLHMEQVRRVIITYPEIFEEYADFTNYNINLKIVRLKRNVSERNVEKLLRMLKEASS